MTHFERVIFEINPVEAFVLCAGIALSAILVGLFHFILYNADSRRRKRFWLILIVFLLFTMGRLIFRSLKIVTPDVNLFIDSLTQALLVIYLIAYVHKSYVKAQYMDSQGTELRQAAFFDIDLLLEELRENGTLDYYGMRIELLPDQPGLVASMKVTVLFDLVFPYQFHKYTETITMEQGLATVNGRTLTAGSNPPIISPNSVHNMEALAGTVFISTLYDEQTTEPSTI